MNNLLLCAGICRREGWKTLDIVGNPDYIAVIPPLPDEVLSQRWDEIEWVHGITSFYPWDAETILKQCYSCMAENGKIVLEQPNARIAAKALLEGDPKWIFGDPRNKDALLMNRWCYTPESLYAALAYCGFRKIELLPARYHVPSRDFRMEAYK